MNSEIKIKIKYALDTAIAEKSGMDGFFNSLTVILAQDKKELLNRVTLKRAYDIANKNYGYKHAFYDGYRAAEDELDDIVQALKNQLEYGD